jgi:aminoglycoside/choline kinase family phosphotransferase
MKTVLLPPGARFPVSSNVFFSSVEYEYIKRAVRENGYWGPFVFDWAGSAGSQRSFYRLYIGKKRTLIIMKWNSNDYDWDYFLKLHEQHAVGDFSPRIIDYSHDLGILLLEDGGDRRLKDVMYNPISRQKKKEYLLQTLHRLSQWHKRVSAEGILSTRKFDLSYFLWESSYFQKHMQVLFPGLSEYFTDSWEHERRLIAQKLETVPQVLLHRDFQSENILLKDQKISFVDIQGARLGPAFYDYASLILDPYVYDACDDDLIFDMIETVVAGSEYYREEFYLCAIQRLMQALGAYGNLGIHKNKKRYLRYIHPAARMLSIVAERSPDAAAVKAAAEFIAAQNNDFKTKNTKKNKRH